MVTLLSRYGSQSAVPLLPFYSLRALFLFTLSCHFSTFPVFLGGVYAQKGVGMQGLPAVDPGDCPRFLIFFSLFSPLSPSGELVLGLFGLPVPLGHWTQGYVCLVGYLVLCRLLGRPAHVVVTLCIGWCSSQGTHYLLSGILVIPIYEPPGSHSCVFRHDALCPHVICWHFRLWHPDF